jgi:polyisoprenoid-binding protein YceI
LDADHTRVLFAVSRPGVTPCYGEFVGASGTLVLDPDTVTASRVEVSVPAAEVSTASKALDGELRGAGWLNAASFPVIAFRSRSVTLTSPRTADVNGDLTLHGVTRPETLKVTFTAAGINPLDKVYATGFEARAVIDRSDFGLAQDSALVGDQVTLIISAAFEKTAN